MEPKILIIGRKQEVINILVEELKRFGRDIQGANDFDSIKTILQLEKIDFVIIGVDLPNDAHSEMQYFIKELAPNTLVHQIEKTDKSSPFKLIEFTN